MLFGISITGCAYNSSSEGSNSSTSSALTISDSSKSRDESSQSKSNVDFGGIDSKEINILSQKDYNSGSNPVINVNQGKSTLNTDAWETNRVIYGNLDKFNRTTTNTAFLEARNHADSALRVEQNIQPTGWHYNHGSTQIWNRGHEIAYSISKGIDQDGNYNPNGISGDQNNPKNLFTQSAFSNQKLQTIYEEKVRNAIISGNKVIFQATPIFRGSELMARGVNLQAKSTDGSLNFNVYIFNVQPGIVFKYADGSASKDDDMKVPTPNDSSSFESSSDESETESSGSTFDDSNVKDRYESFKSKIQGLLN